MAGFRTWTDTDRLDAAALNGYLMGQVVARFATVVERDAQLGLPVEGMISYVPSEGLQRHNGTGWVAVASPAYLAADRPHPGSVPAGTAIWDLTTSAPYWSDGTVWVKAVASSTDVGLDLVDNTADSTKPVSTDQAAAIATAAATAATATALKVSKAGDNLTGDLTFTTVGKGIRMKEGTNARAGIATLAAGTVTIATTAVTAISRVHLTNQTLGTVTAPSALGVSARTAGTSFTVLASQATDTSTVAWVIVEPSP